MEFTCERNQIMDEITKLTLRVQILERQQRMASIDTDRLQNPQYGYSSEHYKQGEKEKLTLQSEIDQLSAELAASN